MTFKSIREKLGHCVLEDFQIDGSVDFNGSTPEVCYAFSFSFLSDIVSSTKVLTTEDF